MADDDSPWKTILERYFSDFLAFFFPEAHAGIDWTHGYTLLDKELQKVVRDAKLGRRWTSPSSPWPTSAPWRRPTATAIRPS